MALKGDDVLTPMAIALLEGPWKAIAALFNNG